MLLMFIFLVSVIIVLSLKKNNISEVEVYKVVKEHMPYSLDYTFKQGFEIKDKRDGSTIESNDNNVYVKMEKLQSDWINKHVVVYDDRVVIVDDNKKEINKIFVKNSVDMDRIKSFFKIK
jgi:maltodextrin utilization protein YvdJ